MLPSVVRGFHSTCGWSLEVWYCRLTLPCYLPSFLSWISFSRPLISLCFLVPSWHLLLSWQDPLHFCLQFLGPLLLVACLISSTGVVQSASDNPRGSNRSLKSLKNDNCI